MDLSDYQKYFRTPLPDEVIYAGQLLTARGYRFCIDFGTTNAVDKATGMVIEDLELEERHGK